MDFLGSEDNFLGLDNISHFSYERANVVIQSLPYEHTSSYLKGSEKGPQSILKASHYVEFYDEEIDKETCFEQGICTLHPTSFKNCINEEAIDKVYLQTLRLIQDQKFVISLGAEHTISYGVIKAMHQNFNNLTVLQIDAHSDLRDTYENSKWSHACVMARVNELNIPITQVAIRAQCIEEANLIKQSENINTIYAHQLKNNLNWVQELLLSITENVYITIDADGFDPSIMPAVGTPEPNGLLWEEAISLFKHIFAHSNVVGFDIVECAPNGTDTITQYNLAKLAYKLIGLKYKS